MPPRSPLRCGTLLWRRFREGRWYSRAAEACVPRNVDENFDEDRLKLWTRRLRHWSRLGILPITRRRDETGSHRLYRREDIYLASVLLRLAGPGLPHNVIKLISDDLQRETTRDGRLFEFWRNAQAHANLTDDGREYFLLMWIVDEGTQVWTAGGTLRAADETLQWQDFYPGDEPTMMLSLTNIFRELSL
jgi:DNA-binding transcriptional MerR regulator